MKLGMTTDYYFNW